MDIFQVSIIIGIRANFEHTLLRRKHAAGATSGAFNKKLNHLVITEELLDVFDKNGVVQQIVSDFAADEKGTGHAEDMVD